jgi:hypothetical protein
MGCQLRANVADFETLKTLVGCTRAWMTSDGGIVAKTELYTYMKSKIIVFLGDGLPLAI